MRPGFSVKTKAPTRPTPTRMSKPTRASSERDFMGGASMGKNPATSSVVEEPGSFEKRPAGRLAGRAGKGIRRSDLHRSFGFSPDELADDGIVRALKLLGRPEQPHVALVEHGDAVGDGEDGDQIVAHHDARDFDLV